MVKDSIEITGISGDTRHDARVRNLQILCILVVVVLLSAIWVFLPYLVVEHRRLETWKIAGLWSGDFIGLLWISRFAFVPIRASQSARGSMAKVGRMTTGSIGSRC